MARTVVGRERELAEVSRFVDSVATRFGVLLLSGPAGIGKTTLWDDAVAAARAKGYDVVVSRPGWFRLAVPVFSGSHVLEPRRLPESRTLGKLRSRGGVAQW